MQYHWSFERIKELYKNKATREELSGLFHSYWDVFNLTGMHVTSPQKTLLADIYYFCSYAFSEKYIAKALETPRSIILPDYAYLELSKNETLHLTSCFYSSLLDPEIYQAFGQVYKQRETHFKFYSTLFSKLYSGHLYYSSIADEAFISVARDKTISDLLAAIHEYGHGLAYKFMPQDLRTYTRTEFCEVESVPLELFAMDFLEKFDALKAVTKKERIDFYNSLINDLKILQTKIAIIKKAVEIPKITKSALARRLFLKSLIDDGLYSKEEISNSFRNSAEYLLPYSLASLIGIELLYIYRENPTGALDIYKEILTINKDTPKESYEAIHQLGINPAEHINDFVRSLKR